MHCLSGLHGSAGRLLALSFLLLFVPLEGEEPGTCAAGDGTCQGTDPGNGYNVDMSFCDIPSSIYRHGGSAQSYRPGAPLSNEVCRKEMSQQLRYNVASWPYTRRSMRKGSAPQLEVTLNILSCEGNVMDKTCICKPLPEVSAINASSVVEIWQANPNGKYSSLRSFKSDSDDCRAQVPLSDDGKARFSTVAPGSTGLMGGLGPGGWESYPYGPPIIHLLVRAAKHKPILVDFPVLMDTNTLEPVEFSKTDLRGVAWVRGQVNGPPLKVTSWTVDVASKSVSINIDVYAKPSEDDQVELCQSFIYGSPASFFLEPMSICGSSVLDFFPL